ncbi:MAG: dUTP diphosphatase [Pseudomonas sp.]
MTPYIKFVKTDPLAQQPSLGTPGAAGFDLSCISLETVGDIVVADTGLQVEFPTGFGMFLLPRSGLAMKGITLANSVGLVDSDYRGIIKLMLTSPHGTNFIHTTISPGNRVAQAVILPVPPMTWLQVVELEDSHRGEGGFGSTGLAPLIPDTSSSKETAIEVPLQTESKPTYDEWVKRIELPASIKHWAEVWLCFDSPSSGWFHSRKSKWEEKEEEWHVSGELWIAPDLPDHLSKIDIQDTLRQLR